MRDPITVNGVRYNAVACSSCVGCAAWIVRNGERNTTLCHALIDAAGTGCSNPESVIWMTDVDFAVHRLTQGENHDHTT